MNKYDWMFICMFLVVMVSGLLLIDTHTATGISLLVVGMVFYSYSFYKMIVSK